HAAAGGGMTGVASSLSPLRATDVRDDAGASSAPATLGDAYAECARVARASSSSFTLAFRLLPPERRSALAALYAYCRVVDDAADEIDDTATAVARWRRE